MSRSNPGLTQLYERYHTRYAMLSTLCGHAPIEVKRWWENIRLSEPPVCWQKSKPGHAFVMDYFDIGLRKVGHVIPDKYTFASDAHEFCYGWFDNNHGEYDSRTGDGLIWGEVYLLPGRKGNARMVAGWRAGGCDGVTIDFGTVFEERGEYDHQVIDMDAARRAAVHADNMASDIAEDERIYRAEQEEQEEADAEI